MTHLRPNLEIAYPPLEINPLDVAPLPTPDDLADVVGDFAFFNNINVAKSLLVNGVAVPPPTLFVRAVRAASTPAITFPQSIQTGWLVPATGFLHTPTLAVVDGGIQIPAGIKGWANLSITASIDSTAAGFPVAGTPINILSPIFSTPSGIFDSNVNAPQFSFVRSPGNTFWSFQRLVNSWIDTTTKGISVFYPQIGPDTAPACTLTFYNITMDLFIWAV